MPDWLFPASVGFAAAVWLIDPWTEDSRLRQLWHCLTDKFSVEHLHAGQFDQNGEPMPQSDIGVRISIRFKRDVRAAKLRLRVFSCTGQGRRPFQHIVPVDEFDAVKGELVSFPIVDMGIPEPGWNHERKRGWGPSKEQTLIGRSRNIVIVECSGRWLTQRHKVFISVVSHVGRHEAPRLYVQDEADDVFDTSPDVRTGEWRYDYDGDG